MATWINRSGETSCPGPGIRNEKGYLYWRILARAGVFQLRERRRDERKSPFFLFSCESILFFFFAAQHSSLFRISITREYDAIRYAPTGPSCPTQIYLISLYYPLVTPPPQASRGYPYARLLKFSASIWAVTVELREETFSIWKFHAWILFSCMLIVAQSDVLSAAARDLLSCARQIVKILKLWI